jgi:hypothetical protein
MGAIITSGTIVAAQLGNPDDTVGYVACQQVTVLHSHQVYGQTVYLIHIDTNRLGVAHHARDGEVVLTCTMAARYGDGHYYAQVSDAAKGLGF